MEILNKSKSFLVRDEIYGRQTMFSIGQTKDEYENSFKEIFKDSEIIDSGDFFEENCTSMGTTISQRNVVIILLRCESSISDLVHECFHAVEFHFNKIDLPHHIDYSSEAWAYYLAFLIEQSINKMKG